MKANPTLLYFILCFLFVQSLQAQHTRSSRLKFWIKPVFMDNSAINEKTEHQVSILADQFDAYFRYVKEMDCFEVVVDLNSSEPLEKDTARPEFELTLSFSDDHYYYRIFPAICIVPDSMVRLIENKLVTIVWSMGSKPVRNKNPFIRHASYLPYPAAGILRDSFYCTIPIVEDSLSKQSAFPAMLELTVAGIGPSCDTPMCKPESFIEKVKTGKNSYYRIQAPEQEPLHSCCSGSNSKYFQEYISLPANNTITHIEVIRPDKSKTTVPVKLKKIRSRLPEWRMVN